MDSRCRRGNATDQARKAERLTKTTSSATTLKAVARELYATKASGWSDGHATQGIRCLEKDVFPWIGAQPIAEVPALSMHLDRPDDVPACCRRPKNEPLLRVVPTQN